MRHAKEVAKKETTKKEGNNRGFNIKSKAKLYVKVFKVKLYKNLFSCG